MEATPGHRVVTNILSMLALIGGGNILLIGAQVARQDLRTDMDNADLLKTWPLQGWQVVLGELLAPTAILTGLLWLCLLQIGLSAGSPRQPWLTLEVRLVAGLALALLLPFLCAMQLLIANTSVVLFPAWAKGGPGQQNIGVEVMGQRMLFMFGQWIVMFVALVPALLAGFVIYIPASWFIETFALLPAAMVAALVLSAELAWGISWLGERFDAYDLSA
jgi:ABC-2 type transport system permease protein